MMAINQIDEFLEKTSNEEFLLLKVYVYIWRSPASLLSDTGADLGILKRHGGWKSNTVIRLCRKFH